MILFWNGCLMQNKVTKQPDAVVSHCLQSRKELAHSLDELLRTILTSAFISAHFTPLH